jgi:WD40 repeat protein
MLSRLLQSALMQPAKAQKHLSAHKHEKKRWISFVTLADDAVSGMIQHTLEGHIDGVNSAVFSPDSMRIASGSDDHTVLIWNAVSGTIEHTLESHTSPVHSVAFSSDGLRVISGSSDHTLRIWDADTGAIQHVLEEYQPLQSLSVFLAASALRDG